MGGERLDTRNPTVLACAHNRPFASIEQALLLRALMDSRS